MTTSAEVLNTPMRNNDAGAATIREYLVALLSVVWRERDGFSGKRPFGNSGWEYEIYDALHEAGHVVGVVDEDGYLDEVDTRTADRLIADAIRDLGMEGP